LWEAGGVHVLSVPPPTRILYIPAFDFFAAALFALLLAVLTVPFATVAFSAFDRFAGGSSSSSKVCLVFRRVGRCEDDMERSWSGDRE